MRQLAALLCLTFAALLFSAGEAWSLPKCPGSYNQNTWHNCFGTYTFADGDKYVGEYASAALNKWLKPRVPASCVVHSFRHSLRDRLRAVECPADIVDQIGGWSTAGVGQGYGKGYPLSTLEGWLRKIEEGCR